MAKAVKISVSSRQRAILEQCIRNKAKSAYRLVERCRFILMSADGITNVEQARRLDVDRQRPRRWRRRWFENHQRLTAAEQEGASDKDLTKLLFSVLEDQKRSGSPGKFTAEQLTQIIAVACESPEESERPVTHWTPLELADEVMQRDIVGSISRGRIRFVYTPRHASWLNQIEIWFSILSRRALKRASFSSLEALENRLVKFIEYFNAVLAKPFRWTYAGKPLHAT